MLSVKCFVLFIISFHLVIAHSRNNTANSTRTGKNGTKKKLRSPIAYDYDGYDLPLEDSDLPNDYLHGKNENGAKEFIDAEHEFMGTRPLQTGDTFTPMEMLPITVKLLSKVDVMGEGKGIVTSSKSPEDLADRLFAAFFLTSKRIVYLTDKDLSGLDALQALALEGDAVEQGRMGVESITESPNILIPYRGQMVGLETGLRTCHYKLLNKKHKLSVRASKANLRRRERVILKLENKMQKKRHLIINPSKKIGRMGPEIGLEMQKTFRQTHRRKGMRLKIKSVGKKEGVKSRRNQNETKDQLTTISRKKGCKWRYICKNPGDLDSCRLHTSCIDENDPSAKEDNIYLAHKEDEHKEEVQQFRKMLGITLLDENVEKILEQHVLEIRPENMRGIDKIETLEEYFNNIIVAQHRRQTTPFDSRDSAQNRNDIQSKYPAHPMKMQKESELQGNNASSESTEYDGQGENEELRAKKENRTEIVQETGKRILGLPIITSTKARKK